MDSGVLRLACMLNSAQKLFFSIAVAAYGCQTHFRSVENMT
jgi:uncharacterized membrane protein YadS